MDASNRKVETWVGGLALILTLMILAMCGVFDDKDTTTPSSSTPAASSSSTPTPGRPSTSDGSSSSAAATGTTPSTPGRRTIADHGYFGCVNREDFDDLLGYLIAQDEEAFETALALGIMLGTVTIFEKGEVVYLIDSPWFSGMVQIRREGELTEYWTNAEAIN